MVVRDPVRVDVLSQGPGRTVEELIRWVSFGSWAGTHNKRIDRTGLMKPEERERRGRRSVYK